MFTSENFLNDPGEDHSEELMGIFKMLPAEEKQSMIELLKSNSHNMRSEPYIQASLHSLSRELTCDP